MSKYQKQRRDTLVYLKSRAFEEIGGEVVQSVAFVIEKIKNIRI